MNTVSTYRNGGVDGDTHNPASGSYGTRGPLLHKPVRFRPVAISSCDDSVAQLVDADNYLNARRPIRAKWCRMPSGTRSLWLNSPYPLGVRMCELAGSSPAGVIVSTSAAPCENTLMSAGSDDLPLCAALFFRPCRAVTYRERQFGGAFASNKEVE